MAQIILKTPGQPVADFSVSGNTVVVAGIAIDCEARQRDTAVTVEIRNNGGTPGEDGDGAYVAQIAIPARRFEEHEIDDEQGNLTVLRDPLPLDPNAVEITLWPTV